jgi:hypothetical protein
LQVTVGDDVGAALGVVVGLKLGAMVVGVEVGLSLRTLGGSGHPDRGHIAERPGFPENSLVVSQKFRRSGLCRKISHCLLEQKRVGLVEGDREGETVGSNEGVAVEGDKVGDDVGSREGVSVVPVGLAVGAMEGLGDGASVGELTGDTDGADVQAQSKPSYGQPAGQVLTVVFFLVSQSSLLAVLTMEEEDSSRIFTRPVTRAIL